MPNGILGLFTHSLSLPNLWQCGGSAISVTAAAARDFPFPVAAAASVAVNLFEVIPLTFPLSLSLSVIPRPIILIVEFCFWALAYSFQLLLFPLSPLVWSPLSAAAYCCNQTPPPSSSSLTMSQKHREREQDQKVKENEILILVLMILFFFLLPQSARANECLPILAVMIAQS